MAFEISSTHELWVEKLLNRAFRVRRLSEEAAQLVITGSEQYLASVKPRLNKISPGALATVISPIELATSRYGYGCVLPLTGFDLALAVSAADTHKSSDKFVACCDGLHEGVVDVSLLFMNVTLKRFMVGRQVARSGMGLTILEGAIEENPDRILPGQVYDIDEILGRIENRRRKKLGDYDLRLGPEQYLEVLEEREERGRNR